MKKLLILLVLATGFLFAGCQKEKDSSEAVLDCIASRTSIRQYTDEAVSEADQEKLLRAGMAAPSACNLQPWRFVVLTDGAVKQEIADSIRPAGPAAVAPLVIVVCGDMTATIDEAGRDYWIEDCSAVSENILLAPNAMGLGGVWLGVYPLKERVDFLKERLGLPSDIVPLGMLAIGHPAENPEPKDKWKPESVHYNKW